MEGKSRLKSQRHIPECRDGDLDQACGVGDCCGPGGRCVRCVAGRAEGTGGAAGGVEDDAAGVGRGDRPAGLARRGGERSGGGAEEERGGGAEAGAGGGGAAGGAYVTGTDNNGTRAVLSESDG